MTAPCRTRMTYLTVGNRRFGVELETRRWDYFELRLVTTKRTRLLTWKAS